jgi:hypothetical protein
MGRYMAFVRSVANQDWARRETVAQRFMWLVGWAGAWYVYVWGPVIIVGLLSVGLLTSLLGM